MVPVWTEQPVAMPWAQPAERQKLSTKAASFTPSQQPPAASADKNGDVSSMIEAAKVLILERASGNIANVAVSQSATGWSIVVEPARRGAVTMEHMLSLAQNALLIAAEQSKNIYVLGYCSPDTAFATKPQGFEATLGVMNDTQTTPCWSLLKKGSCTRDRYCTKQHPALQVPVRVVVEMTQLGAPAQIAYQFKQEAAQILMMVTTMLASVASAASQSFTNEDGHGWRVEIYVREEDMCFEDYYLTIAKNALTEAAKQSRLVYIMGSGETPFVSKSLGFTTTLGEMADQTKACWDVYTQGVCWRESSCRWRHPQCLMPVNVVLKTTSVP